MKSRLLLCGILLSWATAAAAQGCGSSGVFVQVLGSGGSQLREGRAASTYILWIDGKARVLVDIGGGALLRFSDSGAEIADLDAILFTQLQADHSAGLPGLIDASRFAHRTASLPLYGPGASRTTPSTITFVRDLFDSTRGAYRNLGEFLSPLGHATYKLEPHEIPAKWDIAKPVIADARVKIFAAPVTQDPVPMLAWRIDAGGKRIVFAADAAQHRTALETLAANANLLIAPTDAAGNDTNAKRDAQLTSLAIGQIAGAARVRQLALTRRSPRASAREKRTLKLVRRHYSGPIHLTSDLQCLAP